MKPVIEVIEVNSRATGMFIISEQHFGRTSAAWKFARELLHLARLEGGPFPISAQPSDRRRVESSRILAAGSGSIQTGKEF